MCKSKISRLPNLFMGSFVVFVLALLITACSGSSYKDYFPETDGLTYTYHVTVLPNVPGFENAQFVIRRQGQETINGITYWKDVAVLEGLPVQEPEITFWRVDDKGVWEVDEKDPAHPEYLSFPFDAAPGATWSIHTVDNELEQVLVTTEAVILPEQTYNDCIKVLVSGIQNGQMMDGSVYYCKNVGMVKVSGRMSNLQVEYTLKSVSN